MNSPSIVKQKASYETIEFKSEGILFFPRDDQNGNLHVVSSSGEVFLFTDSTSEQILNLMGEASGLCFDSAGTIYVSDLTTKGLFYKVVNTEANNNNNNNNNNTTIENVLVKEFEGEPFKGITSIAFNKEDNTLYFSDSGKFEEASLSPFDCSIYSIDLETRVLKKILTNLSFVYDLCYDNTRKCLYISEIFMNRVLRLKQHPIGVFNSSVFCQFSGYLGPSAMTIDDNGNLFVARYDYPPMNQEIESDGVISVLDKEGNIIGEMNYPKYSEITGIYISPKKRENLYITANGCNGVMKVKISSFTSDLDKYEEALKI